MTDLNQIIVSGNMVHDIGERDIQKLGETTKLTITIANNKSVKQNGEWTTKANFFDIVLWGKMADSLKPYLVKGKSLAIVGRLDQDRWEKDGKKGSKVYITADSIKLLGGREENVDKPAMPQKEQNDLGFKEDIPYEEPEF